MKLFSIFRVLETLVRSYHKDKEIELYTYFTTCIPDKTIPEQIRFYSWKQEFKIDSVAHRLHSFLFYQRESANVPLHALLESIQYIISFYPHDSTERFDCLDYVVDTIEETRINQPNVARLFADILYKRGTIDEQLYAKPLCTDANNNGYTCKDTVDKYSILYTVHCMIFGLPVYERELIYTDEQLLRDFLYFHDVAECINTKHNVQYTDEEIVYLIHTF